MKKVGLYYATKELYYNIVMAVTIQARLDDETHAALERLVERHGWTASEAVRKSILSIDKRENGRRTPKLIGIGMFDSGLTDLATNPKYMEDFGLDRKQALKRKRR